MSRRTTAFHAMAAASILAILACQAPIGEQAQATQQNDPAAFDTSIAGTVAAVTGTTVLVDANCAGAGTSLMSLPLEQPRIVNIPPSTPAMAMRRNVFFNPQFCMLSLLFG